MHLETKLLDQVMGDEIQLRIAIEEDCHILVCNSAIRV